MIVLDTNVVSEITKPVPDQNVRDWVNTQILDTLFVTSITVAEVFFGLHVMQQGRKKAGLEQALDEILKLFDGRIIPFDAQAATRYAVLAAGARSEGKGFPMPDGYIAAVAASKDFAVATRDVGPFLAAGLVVINPWKA